MRALKFLLAVILALAVLTFGGGLLLKKEYRVERSVVVNAPADKVYALIDSSQGWAQWGVWYQRDPKMQVVEVKAGRGVGAQWSWKSESQGNGAMKLTAAVPSQKVGYELTVEGFDASSGELLLAQEGASTRVIWVMQGRMSGPISRWFGLFMDRLVGPDFEGGLSNLKSLAEKA
jgi:hypothetical protein